MCIGNSGPRPTVTGVTHLTLMLAALASAAVIPVAYAADNTARAVWLECIGSGTRHLVDNDGGRDETTDVSVDEIYIWYPAQSMLLLYYNGNPLLISGHGFAVDNTKIQIIDHDRRQPEAGFGSSEEKWIDRVTLEFHYRYSEHQRGEFADGSPWVHRVVQAEDGQCKKIPPKLINKPQI